MKAVATTFDPLIEALLAARGVTGEAETARFLEPSYEAHLHDPMLMKDMDIAVARIFDAMERQERIAVYADFDCDGIPGASVLKQFFDRIEYDNMEVYIPHRHYEGYGLHAAAIDGLKERSVKVIITVDLGVTAIESVAHANALGIDVIVTDHHEPPEILPAAFAILNPKRAPYPDPNLCGAAVAFKLVVALITEGRKRSLPRFKEIPSGWEKWLLDLVGIATIADMVPLVGENRVLARFGLLVLRKTPRPGIAALMRVLGVTQSELTEDDIGFTIGPRVNAASRMDEPELALRLLTTRNASEAESLAVQLEGLNRKRKGVVASMTKEIRKRLTERGDAPSSVTVIGDPEWKPALLGLAANSILDERGGIVCIWGRDGVGTLKGSCRSDGSASIVDLFRASADILIESGGHHASGGFSVSNEQVHTLPQVFRERMKTIKREEKSTELPVAYAIALRDVGGALHASLSQLSPFGMGNEKPLFALENVEVMSVRQFGKANEHLEVMLTDKGARVKAMQFFATAAQFTHEPKEGMRVTVFATLERSSYRGTIEMRLRLVDICSPGAPGCATIISI